MTRTNRSREEAVLFSVYTAREGGFGQELALTLLRGEGLRVEPAGQTAVIVYGGKREQKKAARLLVTY